MIPYVVLILIIILESFLIYNTRGIKNRKKAFVNLVIIELIVFAGLRSTVIGSDTSVYVYAKNWAQRLSLNDLFDLNNNVFGFELGYSLLNNICGYFKLNDQLFFVLIAALIYIPIGKFIYKNCDNPLIAFMVFFAFNHFYYSLGIFREMIAFSLCLLSLEDIKNKRFLIFLFKVFIATLFHTSSVCWIFVYIFYNFVDFKRLYKYIIPIVLFLFISGSQIGALLVRFFPQYNVYLIGEKAVHGGSYSMLLVMLIIYLASFRIKNYIHDSEIKLGMSGLYLALFLQSIAYSFGILGRATCYFTIFFAILIPKIIDSIFSPKNGKIPAQILTSFILLGLTIYTQLMDNKFLCPFKFFWE